MFPALLAAFSCWVGSGLFLGMAQFPLKKSLSLEDQETRMMGWSALKGAVAYTELSMPGSVTGLVSTAVAIAEVGRRNAIGLCWTGARDIFFNFIRKAILDSWERLVSYTSHSPRQRPQVTS